jgi:2'-5' RNA ligase
VKRTFIAIDIPVNLKIKECLNIMSSRLTGEKIKWIAVDDLHLTLKFLGDTEEKTIKDIGTSLEELTQKLHVFSITIKDTGIFKNMNDPRIIWLGIEQSSELTELRNSIENRILQFGFPTEERKFSPHLTVGRIKFLKNKNTLKQAIEAFQGQVLHQFNVPEVIFYESILRKEGPEYIPLGRYKLRDLH